MSSIVVVVGNPQPLSRTRRVAERVAHELAARSGARIEQTIDLADNADRMFAADPHIDALLEQIASADVAVIASPTYKAAYTGLLKSFLDRYPADGLRSVSAVPVLTIGSPSHALAVEHTLRPLLVELGASVPSRGLAFPAGSVDECERIVAAWVDEEWPRRSPIGGVSPPAQRGRFPRLSRHRRSS